MKLAIALLGLPLVSAGIKSDCFVGDDCTGAWVQGAVAIKAPEDQGLTLEEMKEYVIQGCFDAGAGSACIWEECSGGLEYCFNPPPIVEGDPHFKTWHGESFDFHGACDLKYMESPSHNMVIQIRTTQRYEYSYVSSAVVEVNGETFELGAYGNVIVNGVHMTAAEALPKTLGGGDLKLLKSDDKNHLYSIRLADGSSVQLKSFKDLVSVKLLGNKSSFTDSVGLMGSAETGEKLARDGSVMTDFNEFGQEWQVAVDEKSLFAASVEPQAPSKCVMPFVSETRRLGERASRQVAEEACKNWHMNKAACISDVMITGDVELAEQPF